MAENTLTPILGNVEPPSELSRESYYVNSRIYNRMLIDNPNMMYIYEKSDYPLMEIDVAAWLCVANILGDTIIPTKKEMIRANEQNIMNEMNSLHRYKIDSNYNEACAAIPKDHW
eukprot:129058_1